MEEAAEARRRNYMQWQKLLETSHFWKSLMSFVQLTTLNSQFHAKKIAQKHSQKTLRMSLTKVEVDQ